MVFYRDVKDSQGTTIWVNAYFVGTKHGKYIPDAMEYENGGTSS